MRTIEEHWAIEEAEAERENCIKARKIANRTFDIGWICGVPEKELEAVYEENTRFC